MLVEAKNLVRQWNARPELGYLAAYDDEADELVFAALGWPELRRFKALMLSVNGEPVKFWAVGAIEPG